MADRKKPGKRQFLVGYVVVAIIIGAIIWGAPAIVGHSQQTDITSKPKATQTSSTKPELASATSRLALIMSNLKKYDTNVNDSYTFTKAKDPAAGLNKPHYYIAGAAFCDNYDTLYTPQDTTDTGGSANAYGYECGGTIEVFNDTSDAANNITSLQKVTIDPSTHKCLTNQGNTECSYKQVGDVVIHVSDVLDNTTQIKLLNYLSQQVTEQSL